MSSVVSTICRQSPLWVIIGDDTHALCTLLVFNLMVFALIIIRTKDILGDTSENQGFVSGVLFVCVTVIALINPS